jgi:heme oxygenase (biliverdin-producing, ferredoxin)
LSTSLAERLKSETRALHVAAERSSFMGALLRGQMERPAYRNLLRNLHAIYAALEPALVHHAAHPMLAPLVMPALWRLPALVHDLQLLDTAAGSRPPSGRPHRTHQPHQPHQTHQPPQAPSSIQPATHAYVARLHTLDATAPALLLAHAYVRYLGDLSGGQMLRSIVARTLAPDCAGAVAFYDFGDEGQTRALTAAFRSGLLQVPVDGRATDALVDEARSAFERHQQLFTELAAAHGLA